MRYASNKISYSIEDCPSLKETEMVDAFRILSNQTILEFYPVRAGEEIEVTCQGKSKKNGNLFIAGEGGPTNITQTINFNVISKGSILLIRESKCLNPNVGLHELLHALGFDHSSNPGNIMYNVSDCNQVIGDDIIKTINLLYSVPPGQDLAFEDVSAMMQGKYLSANFTVRNHGLLSSGDATVSIYSGTKLIKDVDLGFLDVGAGKSFTLTNLWVGKFSIDELKFIIETDEFEMEEKNNEVILKVSN